MKKILVAVMIILLLATTTYAADPVEGFKTLKIGKNLDECLKEGNLIKSLIPITEMYRGSGREKYKNPFILALCIKEVSFHTDANINLPDLYPEYAVESYVTPDFNVYTITTQEKEDSTIKVGKERIRVTCAVYKGEIYVIQLYGDLDEPFAVKYGKPFSKRVRFTDWGYWRTNDIYIAKYESSLEYYIVDFNKFFNLYNVLINEELKKVKEKTDSAAKNAAKDL